MKGRACSLLDRKCSSVACSSCTEDEDDLQPRKGKRSGYRARLHPAGAPSPRAFPPRRRPLSSRRKSARRERHPAGAGSLLAMLSRR